MSRKEQGEATKKKQNSREDAPDLPMQVEISVLLQYVKMMPMSIRAQFLPGLSYIVDHLQISERNKNLILALLSSCNMEPFESIKNKFIVDLFCRFLKLPKLRSFLNDPQKRKFLRQRSNENHEDGSKALTAFQPNFLTQKESFEPIDFTINPQYEYYAKMWKIYTDTHLNLDYRFKQLNPSYSFYAPPRFFVKVEEMRQFQSNFPQKGNIMMLSFEGSKIVGKKSFAFTQGSTIYWCTKKSKHFEDILNEIIEQKEKQIKQKEAGKKKQINNNEESKAMDQNNGNNADEGLRMNSNFKVAYKIVGHHGKVTSISLSEDELYLLSTGTDRTVKLWCLRQKTLLAEYKGHLATIWSVNFNKYGYFFLTASADKTIKLWVTDDPTPQRVYCGHTEDVTKAHFMSNPDLMISCSEDKTVRIWNVLTTEQMKIFRTQNVTTNISMSLSGRYMMACDLKGKMSLYDFLEGEVLNEFMVPEKDSDTETGVVPRNLKIHDMCFSMDEKQFSCVSSRYILIYSFEKICEKPSKNLILDAEKTQGHQSIAAKEVIYTGRQSNLVYCKYHEKGVLVVGASVKKKQ